MENKRAFRTTLAERNNATAEPHLSFDEFLLDLEVEPFSPDLLAVEPALAEEEAAPSPKSPAVNVDAALDYEGPGRVLEASSSSLRPEQAEALLTISGLLNSDLNPGRVLNDMLKPIRSLFHANRAAVFLRQHLPLAITSDTATINVSTEVEPEDKGEVGPIICAAALGLSQEYINQIITFYETKEFRRIQRLRQPVLVADAQHDYRLNGVRELNRREGFQTMLTLPLFHRQLLIGLLVLYHDQKQDYAPEEVNLLTIFANQAALAISNARLYQDARRREREAAFLAQASRFFNSSLKLRDVLTQVVQASATILGNTALVFIVREGSDEAHPIAYFSKATTSSADWIKTPSPVRTQPPIKVGEGAIGKTIQSGVPFYIRNPKDILRVAPFVREDDNVQSLLCVPLKTRGSSIGVLVSYEIQGELGASPKAKKMHTIGQGHISLAQALADRAAIAIENARLYEAEKREQQAKDEFLSFVAHELRTPLTSIMGYNHMLAKKLQEPGALTAYQANPQSFLSGLQHYSDVVELQASRLYNLTQDIASISQIESGSLDVNLNTVDLVELVRETLLTFEAELKAAPQTRQAHQFKLSSSKPVMRLMLDANATARILRILLSNAVKFSPQPNSTEILVRLSQTPTEVTLAVQDSGIGLRSSDQERIFERFYKARSQAGRANGLGLGLYIAKNLVEAQGGRINVISEEGVGSTFTLTFLLPPKG
jgi:signal transduction histidine kinase